MFGMLVGMGRLSTKSMQLVNGVRNLMFPPVCLFCQQVVDSGDQQQACCAGCFEKIHIWPLSHCKLCGCEMPEPLAPGPCGCCLTQPPVQQQTMNLYSYQGPVRDALLDWKLNGRDTAVRWLLNTAMPRIRSDVGSDTLLLPVPMPLSRMRKSGQHHAADLCRWIADELGCGWQWQLLRRRGEQPRQSTLSGRARRKNLCNAFILSDDYTLQAEDFSSVVIIDDIMTTGATLHYAALACRRLGVPVSVLSLARTVKS